MSISARLEALRQDLRCAARTLRKSPGFVAVVILSLALGIAANSIMFSVIDRTVSPVAVRSPGPPDCHLGIRARPTAFGRRTSHRELVDSKNQNHVFEDIALTSDTGAAPLARNGEPELVRQQSVTPNFFSVLRVKPALGRVFAKSEIQDRRHHDHGSFSRPLQSTIRNS